VSTDRRDLIAALMRAMRESSAQGVLFSHAVAACSGISSSDLECLDIILLSDRASAGELAKATGLTTGAMTGVLDRLEKAGFVQRQRDAADRRKVWITALPEAERQIAPLFLALAAEIDAVLSDYDTAVLKTMLEFYGRARAVLVRETEKLQSSASPAKRERTARSAK
jgi:DNA-binding MarR family transcriptional regulator